MSECALCTRPLHDARIVGTASRHNRPSRRVACLECSLVQVCPAPTEGELMAFYSSHEYRSEHGPVPITVRTPSTGTRTYRPTDPDYTDALTLMGEFRAEWTSETAGLIRGMRLLEVGSGDGYTLREYVKRGLLCTGIEPDEEEAEKSRQLIGEGVTIHACGFDDARLLPDERFDAVVAFHVLEHLHDPVSALKRWRSLLTPRGAVCIEVPNILMPGIPVDTQHYQWVHLFDFSQHTLTACLVRAGFEPLQMTTAGGNLRAVARPATAEGTYAMPHGGAYVEGYLDAIRVTNGGQGG